MVYSDVYTCKKLLEFEPFIRTRIGKFSFQVVPHLCRKLSTHLPVVSGTVTSTWSPRTGTDGRTPRRRIPSGGFPNRQTRVSTWEERKCRPLPPSPFVLITLFMIVRGILRKYYRKELLFLYEVKVNNDNRVEGPILPTRVGSASTSSRTKTAKTVAAEKLPRKETERRKHSRVQVRAYFGDSLCRKGERWKDIAYTAQPQLPV